MAKRIPTDIEQDKIPFEMDQDFKVCRSGIVGSSNRQPTAQQRRRHRKRLEKMHMHWPSFENIHKMLADGEMDETRSFLALEKLDGSNLGLEIHPQEGIVALHGRNTILWHSGVADAEPFTNRRYGKVHGPLDQLADLVPKLMALTQFLAHEDRYADPETIVFYGEWFEGKFTPPSWHPFGYGYRNQDDVQGERGPSFRTMTSRLHALFVEYGLEPPKLLFSGGNLAELVENLFPHMLEPPSPRFEGVFITTEAGGTRDCGKWKTRTFEEQLEFVIPPQMAETLSLDMVEAVEKLRRVFESKPGAKRKKIPKQQLKRLISPGAMALDRQIGLAFDSVLSKSHVTLEDIQVMSDRNRREELKRLSDETLCDLIETLAASGVNFPTTKKATKEIKKRVGKLVTNCVMMHIPSQSEEEDG